MKYNKNKDCLKDSTDMSPKLYTECISEFVSDSEFKEIQPRIEAAREKIKNKNGEGASFLGWIDLPENYRTKHDFIQELDTIKKTAEQIRSSCGILVVIGIGGSYLGTRAAIEFIRSQAFNNLSHDGPDIYFTGNSLSSFDIDNLISICNDSEKDICLNIISKSGRTTEPALAFRIFRELLEKKYGEEGARERIFVTAGKKNSNLYDLANDKGYKTFAVPDDIGGRYSVMTPVGLLPLAVAGLDIDAILGGAAQARTDTSRDGCDAEKYAAIRNILLHKGKAVEIFASYESRTAMIAEWWKQLFGESEGKDGRGLFPASVTFSTDLHSLGQYIQEGTRNIFETVLYIKESKGKLTIPASEKDIDGFKPLEGKNFDFVTQKAFLATLIAHMEGGVPNLVFALDRADEYNLGYMFYFFEYSCALSAYMLGVNPFNQPGVEDYKNNMYALLGMSGQKHDERRAKLTKPMELLKELQIGLNIL